MLLDVLRKRRLPSVWLFVDEQRRVDQDEVREGTLAFDAKPKEREVERRPSDGPYPLAMALPRSARDHHVLVVLAERDAIEVGEVPRLQKRFDLTTERIGLRGANSCASDGHLLLLLRPVRLLEQLFEFLNSLEVLDRLAARFRAHTQLVDLLGGDVD